MSFSKKAKKKRIRTLLVLLLITGAMSAGVINGYIKNRPQEVSTADGTGVKPAHKNNDTSAKKPAPEESSEQPPETESLPETAEDKPSEPAQAPLSDDAVLNELVAGMSLHEKICQMFIVTPEGLTGYDLVTISGTATLDCLKDYPVGGLIYFSDNLISVEQTTDMISGVQASNLTVSDIPLFIAVDEEGGDVARCAEKLGTTEFKPMYTYRSEGADTAYSNAFTIAQDIAELGFNLDFAPVADTWSNPDNAVIGKRAYSDDFEESAELVASAVKGFRDGGVACSVKHFPGHGDTEEDSHDGMAFSYKTIAELEKEEYLAFESGIEAGADMVMVGHITMANVDELPASLSRTFITDELRGKLGFDGVIVTDALGMGALANYYTSDEIAVEVIKAGGDILLMPADLQTAVEGVENAVKNGDITEDRINESVIRILKLKKDKSIL